MRTRSRFSTLAMFATAFVCCLAFTSTVHAQMPKNDEVIGYGYGSPTPGPPPVSLEEAKAHAETFAKVDAHERFQNLQEFFDPFGLDLVITEERLTKPAYLIDPVGGPNLEAVWGAEYSIFYEFRIKQ